MWWGKSWRWVIHNSHGRGFAFTCTGFYKMNPLQTIWQETIKCSWYRTNRATATNLAQNWIPVDKIRAIRNLSMKSAPLPLDERLIIRKISMESAWSKTTRWKEQHIPLSLKVLEGGNDEKLLDEKLRVQNSNVSGPTWTDRFLEKIEKKFLWEN